VTLITCLFCRPLRHYALLKKSSSEVIVFGPMTDAWAEVDCDETGHSEKEKNLYLYSSK
jgi:hypothetical protein